MPIGFARLPIDVPQITEITALPGGNWHPHYNKADYEGDWEVYTLRSPGGDADNIMADLAGKSAYADTPDMARLPSVKKLVERLQCEIMSVRLLNLKAGAVIKQHRDNELSFEMGEARLHFPIVTNGQVEFYVNDVRVTMQPGECWYINANMPHRVANYGATNRIHLVIDCWVNDWLKSIFLHADKLEFEEIDNHEQTLQIIQALRLQNTETANQLANKMETEMKNNNKSV